LGQERIGEEDLSTEQYTPEKNPWILKTHVHQGRAFGFKTQEGQRPEETGG